MYYLNSRYYNPEIGRFINADGLIGEPGDILGHNLYAYTQNNPVMMVDDTGYSPVPISGLFTIGNGFELASTVFQLLIGGAGIAEYRAIINAARPNNIGIGLWNKQRTAAMESFKGDLKTFKKASNILAAITIAVQVGDSIFTDIDRGYSTDRIVSNAVVNLAIYSATAITCAQAGAVIGSFIPVPILGTVVGMAVGYAIGTVVTAYLNNEPNGKSRIDSARDWVYNTWNSW